MVGRNSTEKRPATVSAGPPDAAATPTTPSSLETHSVPPPAGSTAEHASGSPPEPTSPPRKAAPHVAEPAPPQDPPLGSTKRKLAATPVPAESSPGGGYLPQSGQTFLQVAAVGRNEADGIADVLNKKGFHAHSVPKPGSPAIYRVLIGPIRDTADLSSTRDELRKTGFRDVIVQHY